MLQGFPEVGEYKVLVECITYNHAQFIEDTLCGFAMQQTSFPYICCVYDDASPDGEQEVLRQWVNDHCNPEDVKTYDHPLTIILMAPDKDNPNCIYAIHLQKVNTWGKPEKRVMMRHWKNQCEYVALCEGDDYWIDPLKLQKQVDFLEANPEYVITHTGFQYLGTSKTRKPLTNTHTESNLEIINNNDNIVVQILDHNKYRIQTCTVLFRRSTFDIVANEYSSLCRRLKMGDTPLWLLLFSMGKIHFMPEETSKYRLVDGSASHSKSIKGMLEFGLSVSEMRLYFMKKYTIPEKYKKKFNQEYIYFLTRYLWIEPSYKPEYQPIFESIYSRIKFYILTHTFVRWLCKYIYIYRNNKRWSLELYK